MIGHMKWASPSLVQALLEAPAYLQIDIRVHVTSLGADTPPSPAIEKFSEKAVTEGLEYSLPREADTPPSPGIEKFSEKAAIEGLEYELPGLPSTPCSSTSAINDERVVSNSDLVRMRGVRVEKGRPHVKRILDEEISCSSGPVSVDGQFFFLSCQPRGDADETYTCSMRTACAIRIGALCLVIGSGWTRRDPQGKTQCHTPCGEVWNGSELFFFERDGPIIDCPVILSRSDRLHIPSATVPQSSHFASCL